MKAFKSHYLNSNMSPLDIVGKQMDFLYEQGKKIAIDYQDESFDIEIQKEKEIEKNIYCDCGGKVIEQWYGNIDDSLLTCEECKKVLEV